MDNHNYFSESNIQYCEEGKKIDAYIHDNHFRNRDPRFGKDYPRREKLRKNLFTQTDFIFEAKENCFTCPAGKKPAFERTNNIRGYRGRVYLAEAAVCAACLLRHRCLKKGAKKRTIFVVDVPRPKTFSKKMIEKIDSPNGRDVYSRRMGIVEPVFANIKVHKGLFRFTLRTKKKVNVRLRLAKMVLFCLVHNIGKIAKCILLFAFSMRNM